MSRKIEYEEAFASDDHVYAEYDVENDSISELGIKWDQFDRDAVGESLIQEFKSSSDTILCVHNDDLDLDYIIEKC